MVLMRRPLYLALFSLTLVAVIAGSGAVMALVGKGRDVMVFGMGVGVGMSLVSALSMELWQLSRQRLAVMQQEIIRALSGVLLGEINPHWLLTQCGNLEQALPPQHASDIHLEIECRRLLDRMHQLLETAVSDTGHCHYCKRHLGHTADCPVPAAQQLYGEGKARRVPWREYKKTLPKESL
ncbi:MAG: hypothetical protein AAGC93_24575 [Cyanobacteria bacterium P01_F01_bin.53]